jgi:type I restriction enzyme S subunit
MTTYDPTRCAVFCKVKDEYGMFSNMAGGYPLQVNDTSVRSSEALYQACRFPEHPEIQQKILDQKSPMAAKMVSKPHKHLTRSDWDAVKVSIMYWCVEMKFRQHVDKLGSVLLSTAGKPIVELSKNDDFWGAIPRDGTLVGKNVLGEILVLLRHDLANYDKFNSDPPLNVELSSMKLLNELIF